MLSFYDALLIELMLFSVVGFLIGGLDDFLIDLVWSARTIWRVALVGSRRSTQTMDALETRETLRLTAILIPMWDEAAVAGMMLRHTSATLRDSALRIIVGCYPNDPETLTAVRQAMEDDDRILLALNTRPGPTTKADCLNQAWRVLCDHEKETGTPFHTVILHDAEDMIHPAEPRLFNHFMTHYDFVQIPVLPLQDQQSHWIAGHYCDEFAEAHAKVLVVRAALGAGIPAAGVGCAFSRPLLQTFSDTYGGTPFRPECLTEDYELGLQSKAIGSKGALVRIAEQSGGPVISVRSHFPATIETAVRQKARWMAGIALSGWDNLGWGGTLIEVWMRMRDRRAMFAALILCAAYLTLIMVSIRVLAGLAMPIQPLVLPPWLSVLLFVSQALLLWRLFVRACFVKVAYGWTEAARSIPRTIICNVIAIMAARRAIMIYWRQLRSGTVVWDKTHHHFPKAESPR